MATKLIVGLGNPGSAYALSRHNVGFRCADHLAQHLGIAFDQEKKKGVFGRKPFPQGEVVILKPQTFANLSAENVLYIASFLRVEQQNICVFYDDRCRNLGSIEMETNFDAVRHTAVQLLAQSLQSHRFARCAFGIGPAPRGNDLDAWLLGNFSAEEETQFPSYLDRARQLALGFLGLPSP